MSIMQFDRTLTDNEVRAMVGPMFGLGLGDDFDITIIVEARQHGAVRESVFSTTDDMSMIERACA